MKRLMANEAYLNGTVFGASGSANKRNEPRQRVMISMECYDPPQAGATLCWPGIYCTAYT